MLAAPKPFTLFRDGAVLPRNREIVIFGNQGQPGEKITVHLQEKEGSGLVDATGRWQVQLPSLTAGGPYRMQIEAPSGTTIVQNLLVGDLWLCSGQSNMGFPIKDSAEREQAQAYPPDDKLRWINVPIGRSLEPQNQWTQNPDWNASNPETVPNVSAVAWHFGLTLKRETGVPVGLVVAAWGGTEAQGWTPRETLTSLDPELVEKYDQWTKQLPVDNQGKIQMPDPKTNPPFGHSNTPMGIYNFSIHPLTPAAFTGVLWYQGEQDSGRGYRYKECLTALIQGWRSAFTRPDLPFLIIQLPGFGGKYSGGFPETRRAQADAVKETAQTALIVTVDTGEKEDIHPKAKAEIGRRSGLAAAGFVHQLPVDWQAPAAESIRAGSNHSLLVQFSHTGKKLLSLDGKTLRSFELAGSDGKFIPATAEILESDPSIVLVQSPDLQDPRFVRYASFPYPDANLGNDKNLAAAPFSLSLK